MHIIVCIKQVPNTEEITINKETGSLIRSNVQNIINPLDLHALLAAVSLKKNDTKITVLSMGPMHAKDSLIEALAYGADRAILLSDI